MSDSENPKAGLSIGAVSEATGIGIETLRMWERRYGAPESIRLPSGHRRYAPDEVDRLRLVSRALENGYRPREVAAATADDLRTMLEQYRDKTAERSSPEEAERHREIKRWLEAALEFDDNTMSDLFYNEWALLGPLRFVTERCAPFLERVGDAWKSGEISVSHEHFSSEKLNDFLAAQWRRLNERNQGPPLLVAGLPGDLHRLGMQMCSTVAALAERKIIFIGSQTPLRELVLSVNKFSPLAVCLSISITMDARFVRDYLRQLRLEIPTQIVIGGCGAPENLDGIDRMQDLLEFHEWVRGQRA